MKPSKTLYILISLALIVYVLSSITGNGEKAQIAKGAVGPDLSKNERFPPMHRPVRIASSAEGDVFVSDYAQGYVFILDNDLNTKKAFAVAGRPLGVAWGQGKIFVGNETTRRVEVYNRNGKLLYELGGAFASPTDIAIDDAANMVFVVDGPERVVKVFDISGNYISEIPEAGVTQTILANPTGIAIDPGRREIAVSDYGNPRNRIPPSIKVYDYDGLFRFSIAGNAVQSPFLFSRPQGLAVDSVGNFFLVDAMIGKVLVFDRNTRLGIKSLGSFGSGTGELRLPLDVIIDSESGDVLVTDNRNSRVQIFSGGGLP